MKVEWHCVCVCVCVFIIELECVLRGVKIFFFEYLGFPQSVSFRLCFILTTRTDGHSLGTFHKAFRNRSALDRIVLHFFVFSRVMVLLYFLCVGISVYGH